MWNGFSDTDTTWEPIENLCESATAIRHFRKAREEQDAEDKRLAREAKAARRAQYDKDQEVLRVKAIEIESTRDTSMGGDKDEAAAPDAVPADRLPKHKHKSTPVWDCFDLSKNKPACTLPDAKHSANVCGAEPAPAGGTANYWAHLRIYHRAEWLQKKRMAGMLTQVGEAELRTLEDALGANHAINDSNLVKSKLPADAKQTLDRLCAEWIVDDDCHFNAAETSAHHKLMSATTAQAYDGCCGKTVHGYVTDLADEGKNIAKEENTATLDDGLKAIGQIMVK